MAEFDAKAHVAHMAALMELPIDDAWRPSVIANMQATGRAAALILSVPLDDHVEPAPVFEP